MRSAETLELWQQALATAATELSAGHVEARSAVRRLARAIAHATGAGSGLEPMHDAAIALEQAQDAALDEPLMRLRQMISLEAARGQEHSAVLVIDDDGGTRRLLERILSSSGQRVLQAASAAQAQAILEREPLDLVLLDLVLPDDDGRSVLMRIRSSPRMAGTPVYVLSGQVGALARTECLALGADGFIEKPFDPQSLTLQLNAALQQAQERRRQAARDALTGLPNRAAFAELFAKFQAQAARSGRPLTLAIIDLDDLKTLNDTHGHLSGDRAIGHFARVVRQTLRGSDVLTRWGGDEFVALLPDTSEAGADDVLGRVRQALRDQPVELPEGRRRTLTFSAGAALAGSLSQDDALAEADRRVYAAKAAGRDRAITTAVPTEALRHTLLLAEDDAVTAAIVQRRVGDSNLNIVHVTNGRSAWELLGERTFSLAILDVQMPEMDGFELLRKIRADPRLTRLPVIMLTALGNEADVIQAFDAGASDYVPKPFSPAELVKRVHRLLKR